MSARASFIVVALSAAIHCPLSASEIVLPDSVELHDVALAPDGTRLAAVGRHAENGTIMMWDRTSGKLIMHVERPGAIVKSVAFTPSGGELITADTERLEIRDVATGETLSATPHGWHLCADGNRVLCGDANRVWIDSAGREQAAWSRGDDAYIHRHVLSPDGTKLALAIGFDVIVLDAATLAAKPVRPAITVANIESIAFAPDSRTLAIGCEGSLRTWNLTTGKIQILADGSREDDV